MSTQFTYEIRIAGRLDETARPLFAGLEVRDGNDATLIIGRLDQAALHGVLEMIWALDLDLLAARRIHDTLPRTLE